MLNRRISRALTAGRSLLNYRLPTTNDPPPTTYNLLPTTHYLLLIACYLLPTTYVAHRWQRGDILQPEGWTCARKRVNPTTSKSHGASAMSHEPLITNQATDEDEDEHEDGDGDEAGDADEDKDGDEDGEEANDEMKKEQ